MANKIIKSIWLIFVIGLILRLILPMEREFNFDQDQIALNAFSIAHGDLTSLGPQTSNLNFFTGPLIYYIAAVFYRLTNFHPLANAFTAASVYVLTFILVRHFFKLLFPGKLVSLYLAIYALSPYLVQLNRITWNPGFSFLSGSLVLASLLKTNYLGIFIGMFLSYQSSFSGFVMSGVLLLYLLWQRKNFRLILAGFSGLAVSLLPLFIFDIRHNFMNFISLGNFIYNALFNIGAGFLSRIGIVTVINFENFSKLLTGYFFPRLVLVIFGLMLLISWLRQHRSFFSPLQKNILLMWMLAFPLAGLFYGDGLPEYYFLMQLPAQVLIVADLIYKIKKQVVLVYLFMLIVSLGVIITSENGYLLQQKYKATQYIKSRSGDRPVELIFDMDYSQQFGWEYLTKYFQLNRVPQGEPVHLIFPALSTTRFSQRFGNIGILYEP
jgi:hypothetical protein